MRAPAEASSESGDQTPSTPVKRVLLLGLVAVIGFVIDQSTKEWALRALADGPIPVIGDWFRLRLIFNPGAAFSLGTDSTIVFTVISTVAAVVVLVLAPRVRSPLWVVGLGLLLAGITGNLFDRVFRQPEPFHGHVVDFLSFGSFPVFNVADMCINVAAGVIIVQSFRGIRLDGTRDTDAPASDATGEHTSLEQDPAPHDQQENQR